MLLVPQHLWRPTRRDLQLVPFQLLARSATTVANATTVNAILAAPGDQLLVIENLFQRAATSGGAIVSAAVTYVANEGLTQQAIIKRTIASGGSTINDHIPVNQIIIPPLWSLIVGATFTLADPTNQAELHVTGFTCARGNIGI